MEYEIITGHVCVKLYSSINHLTLYHVLTRYYIFVNVFVFSDVDSSQHSGTDDQCYDCCCGNHHAHW